MAKDKQQKKKEREKRVAQKKHAATLKRMQAQATESKAAGPKTKKVFQPEAAPKTNYVASANKSNFIQRRSGS